ncbi:MAG: hypothetical protein RLZZ584_4354, partial [Pseudomonadota bacterium]
MLISLFAGHTLRDATRREWNGQLANLSSVLAEHAAQTMFSAHTVMDSIAEEFKGQAFRTAGEFERFAVTRNLHEGMTQRIQGNPIIAAAMVLTPDGRLLASTRLHPAPPVDLSEREFVAVHRASPLLAHHTGAPVRSKANGMWLFHLSQPVYDVHGRLAGILAVAVSIEWFSELYHRLVTQFGEGASISLWRDDFMLMTRWPFTENQIGKVNHQTATCEMIGRERLGYGVRTHGSLQEFTGVSGVDRLAALRV